MYYDGFAIENPGIILYIKKSLEINFKMENLVAFHHDISSFLMSWLPQKVIYKTVKVITNNKTTP